MKFSIGITASLATALILSALILNGCSSAPNLKGSGVFYGPAKDAHQFERELQEEKSKASFFSIEKQKLFVEDSLKQSDCYRITSASGGWGIFQADQTYFAEGIHKPENQIAIVLAPIYEENRVFPTPTGSPNVKVYRIDREAPYSTSLVQQLNQATMSTHPSQDSGVCIRLSRIEYPDTGAQDYSISNYQWLPIAKAKSLKPAESTTAAQAVPPKAEAKSEAKPEEKLEAKPEVKAEVKPETKKD